MKPEWAQKIFEVGKELGLDVRLLSGYSGKGMNGITTVAVRAESQRDLIVALVQVAANQRAFSDNADEIVEVARRLRFDNLGRDVLAY